jgi:hypothetical protein
MPMKPHMSNIIPIRPQIEERQKAESAFLLRLRHFRGYNRRPGASPCRLKGYSVNSAKLPSSTHAPPIANAASTHHDGATTPATNANASTTSAADTTRYPTMIQPSNPRAVARRHRLNTPWKNHMPGMVTRATAQINPDPPIAGLSHPASPAPTGHMRRSPTPAPTRFVCTARAHGSPQAIAGKNAAAAGAR